MNTTEQRVLTDVVSAFVRSIRAMGYYDEKHPVFEATRKEAHEALQAAWRRMPLVTLGCGGHHLLIDEAGTALHDPPAAALARRMFDNAVVAIRLWPQAQPADLGTLMQVLAEREDRVRAAGGVSIVLDKRGVSGIEVLEVDIDALFAGRQGDIPQLAAEDPVAELALRAILRFRDTDEHVGGDALHISLEQVNSPGSLGDFLDELLEQAEPGVVPEGANAGGLTGDDLADFASQAFFRSYEELVDSQGGTIDLAQSAEVLSNALVRLSPEARFALLRRLAGSEDLESRREDAMRNLGDQLDDKMVTSAIASALFDQQGDPATVRAIGNLIRRIRPVEAERKRLLSAVDGDMRHLGKPIDGVLWQEMQSRAFENSALGLLEMSMDNTKGILREYAMARRQGQLHPVAGQDILHTVDASVVDYWTTHALVEILERPGRLGPGAIESCRLQLDRLDASGALDECMELLQAMMRRTDDEDNEELSAVLVDLLNGERGARWSVRLLQHSARPSQMLGEILLTALDQPGDRAYKQALIQRLACFERDALLRLARRFMDRASPLQAQSLVLAGLQQKTTVGVRVARFLLRHPTLRVREVVLKTVVERPDRDVVALLAHVAGWKGERYTKSLLGLDGREPRGLMHRMQLSAVGALGLTRHGLAARPLLDILVRPRLFNDREQDELRVAAAQALRTNASPEAEVALREASQHKKKNIRDAVQRVLGRGTSDA